MRVRSGLICFQLIPPSIVFQRVLARRRACGSTCEKTTGAVRTEAEIGRPHRRRRDVLDLAGAPVEARHLAAVDDVGVERVGRDVAVLFDADRVPFAEGDLAVVAAARDAGRAALLLAAADAVGKRVVGGDVVHLRGRLVVPGAPGLAAVDGDDGALVARDQDDVRVVRG